MKALDPTLEFLRSEDIVQTVDNYLALNYLGDVENLEQLAEFYPEDYAEVLDLIADGELKIETPGSETIQ